MKLKRVLLVLAALVSAGLMSTNCVRAAQLAGWLEADSLRLKPEELRLVEHSLRAIARLELGPSHRPVDYFSLLFGGESGQDVLRYLRPRILYLGKDTDEDPSDPESSGTYAYNYGSSWLDLIYKREVLGQAEARPTTAPFRRGKIAITSPRAGLVILGSAFTAADTSDLDRMETLVHEARHSDCPVKPGAEDLEAYMKGRYRQVSEEGRSCTNLHMPCPRGHVLAGELACDSHAWGGYMVGYVFAEEIFKRCRNCSELERQQALVTAKEDLTRLTPELREALHQGTLPDPVMESLP